MIEFIIDSNAIFGNINYFMTFDFKNVSNSIPNDIWTQIFLKRFSIVVQILKKCEISGLLIENCILLRCIQN